MTHAVATFDLRTAIRQCRVAPLRMGDERGLLVIHANHPSIDPWHKAFTLPADTLKLTAFSLSGERLWHRDIGPGMIPGMWFMPVFPFDLDGDGVDEIFLVNNRDPVHPLNHEQFILEYRSAVTGDILGSIAWPGTAGGQDISHTYRNFINGGYARGLRRLVTAQGTYGNMFLQCWDESLAQVWSRRIGAEDPGCRGSHMFPIVDIDGDGRDELLFGERCIDIDTGADIWVADETGWRGHSDIVQPVLDVESGDWRVYTCRESPHPAEARGVVMFDSAGRELWGQRGMGHVHDGWAARLGDDGAHLFFAQELVDRGDKRVAGNEYLYDGEGNGLEIEFPLTGSLPVDFDGDGRHELVYRAGERRGQVVDRHGKEMARVEGGACACAKVLDLPGEQIVTSSPDGRVRVWTFDEARDSAAAQRRYEHPFYEACLRTWAVGYNWRNLGGL